MVTLETLDTTREHTHIMAWHRKHTPSSTEITWPVTSVCITLHTWQTGCSGTKGWNVGRLHRAGDLCRVGSYLMRKYLQIIVRWTARPLCARTHKRDSRHICGRTRNNPSQRFPLETRREGPRFRVKTCLIPPNVFAKLHLIYLI